MHVHEDKKKTSIHAVRTCIDVANSALASGAGIARDSLDPLISRSAFWPLSPAPCLYISLLAL